MCSTYSTCTYVCWYAQGVFTVIALCILIFRLFISIYIIKYVHALPTLGKLAWSMEGYCENELANITHDTAVKKIVKS